VLEVRRLRLLRELAHRGTIAAVAEALSYTPSAVSQQLSVLETEAGARLLEPVGRRVRLTRAAELLVARTETILEELERAGADLASAASEVSGTLRVAAFQTAVLALVPAALTSLRTRHPALRIEVTELEPEASLPALVAREFDVVLAEEYPGHPQPRAPEIERRKLLSDELRLVMPAAWSDLALDRLSGRPWVMEPPGTPAREWATAVCRDAGFEPDVVHTSTDLVIHLRLVEAGHAAALLPDLAQARGRTAISTRALPGKPVRQVFSAVRRGGMAHPAVVAFEDAVERAARQASQLGLGG
jgi:DNA-binding transcriptional LysR family regulator